MQITETAPGEVICLSPASVDLASIETTRLVKTNLLEVIRIKLKAGKEIPTHTAPGEITVQCIDGRVAFTVGSSTQELSAGQWLYLTSGQPHAVRGVQDSLLLITIAFKKQKPPEPFDIVQEASEE